MDLDAKVAVGYGHLSIRSACQKKKNGERGGSAGRESYKLGVFNPGDAGGGRDERYIGGGGVLARHAVRWNMEFAYDGDPPQTAAMLTSTQQ